MKFIDRIKPTPIDGGFKMKDYWVWCGSVIKSDDGLYHMFASRWPKELPFFNGYKVASEIVRAESESPEGPYVFKEVVLPDRGSKYWDGRMTHNPVIRKYNGKYLLYYIGGTYNGTKPVEKDFHNTDEGLNTKIDKCYKSICIGLATSDTVYGPWERMDSPILSPRKDQWDNTIVTNPAPCFIPDGSVKLYYRTNTPEGLRIGMAEAKSYNDSYERHVNRPVLILENSQYVEDEFVWWNGSRFEMIAKDMDGSITGELHSGVHAYSSDGIHWEVAKEPKAYSRTIKWSNGDVTTQGCLERPQILFENGKPAFLFVATGNGIGGFDNVDQTWNIVIPLLNVSD